MEQGGLGWLAWASKLRVFRRCRAAVMSLVRRRMPAFAHMRSLTSSRLAATQSLVPRDNCAGAFEPAKQCTSAPSTLLGMLTHDMAPGSVCQICPCRQNRQCDHL